MYTKGFWLIKNIQMVFSGIQQLQPAACIFNAKTGFIFCQRLVGYFFIFK